MKVYGDIKSGNCYKIKLLMQLLHMPHEWIHIDILSGQSHTEEFIHMNRNGKIPVLEFEPGKYLSESNAILNYLAEGTQYLPTDRLLRARILEWQFFEQYSHEPYIAVARYINTYLGLPKSREEEYHSKQSGGHKALAIIEAQLSETIYLIGDHLSIADITLFAYTHVAHEGGFDLKQYPHILHWISNIQSQPNFIAMTSGD